MGNLPIASSQIRKTAQWYSLELRAIETPTPHSQTSVGPLVLPPDLSWSCSQNESSSFLELDTVVSSIDIGAGGRGDFARWSLNT